MDKKTVKGEGGGTHPESGDKQAKVYLEDMKSFISQIDADITAIINRRTVWEERQVRWYKERYGIRGKKNFPFPGCSNMHIPLIDMQIKKLLPALILFRVSMLCWDATKHQSSTGTWAPLGHHLYVAI